MPKDNRLYFSLMVKSEEEISKPVFVKHLNPDSFSKIETNHFVSLASVKAMLSNEGLSEPGLYIFMYHLESEIFEFHKFDSKLDTKYLFGEDIDVVSKNIFSFMGMDITEAEDNSPKKLCTAQLNKTKRPVGKTQKLRAAM